MLDLLLLQKLVHFSFHLVSIAGDARCVLLRCHVWRFLELMMLILELLFVDGMLDVHFNVLVQIW